MGATYGYDVYGNSTYGPSAPTGNYPGSQVTVPVVNTAYVLPGLTAQAQDYANILVSWQPLPPGTMNSVSEFRLLSSPWGFPVDQNDGTILLDVTGSPPAPGIQCLDNTATPGKVRYYGVYVLVGSAWLRSGFTACLLPSYNAYDVKLMSDLPPFFQNQVLNAVTTDIPVGAANIPSSGGSVTSPYDFPVNVWLSAPANVAVNGTQVGQQTSFFVLPALGTVTITYSGGLTWTWVNPATQLQNNTLAQYLSVLGYGLDLVKSQYDMKFRSLNDPMTMSLGDLKNLCAEIGLPYNPEIPAYTTRKAAKSWGHVMQERGTLAGIGEHITLLSGYAADIQTSRNFMVDDDQANPADPVYPQWSANTKYNAGEIVQFPAAQPWSIVSAYPVGAVVLYNDLLYTCTVTNSGQVPTNTGFWNQNVLGPFDYVCLVANTGQQPSGSTSATTFWSCMYGGVNNGAEFVVNMNISGLAGNAGTWEYTNAAGTNLAENIGVGFPSPQVWQQSGATPQTGPNGFANTFRASNNSGSTQSNTWLRSVARSSSDITNTKLVPDPQLIVEHAVPLPDDLDPWSAMAKYQTNDVVTYNGINYIALRQSTGATPPAQGAVMNQNFDFETTISPWFGDGFVTVTQSTAEAYHGTHSMLLSYTTPASGFQTAVHAFSESVPVIPGATYQMSALTFSPTAVTLSVPGNWTDPFGTYINGTFPSVAIAANTWTKLTTSFTVPSNAATVFIAPTMNTPAASTTYQSYWDVVELTCVATPEWAPLGSDPRLPVTMSGFAIADLGFNPTVSATITPFVEWYDNWGNLISRVFARSPSTSGGYPVNYQFDGFNTGAGLPLAGRQPFNPSSVWSVPVGAWSISSNGNVYAGSTDNDAIGIVASPAQGTVAVTVTNPAQSGDDCGALFWYLNTSNFWMAGLSNLYYVASGTTRIVAYTGSATTGDRIYTEFNNTTSTTNTPNGNTVTGPSVIVYKNSRVQSNILVVVGSGGTATQTAVSSLTTPYLPGTSATSSNAGIASIAQ